MSTWRSERFRLAAFALATALAGVAAAFVVLGTASRLAANHHESIGYDFDEPMLRYLMPGYVSGAHAGDWLWLTGPSAAGEALLVEPIAEAFAPLRVLHGASAMAVLGETRALLEYFERRHGPGALPKVVIVGSSPRYLASIAEESRLEATFDAYAPDVNVERRGAGFEFVPKSFFESVAARFGLAAKMPAFYRTMLIESLLESIFGLRSDTTFERDLEWRHELHNPTTFPRALRSMLGAAQDRGVVEILRSWLESEVSPHMSHGRPPKADHEMRSWIGNGSLYWPEVIDWEPSRDEAARAELARLASWTRQRDIDLWFVHFPEHPILHEFYDAERFAEYGELMASALGPRFIDLEDVDVADQMYDIEHPTYGGAQVLMEALLGELRARGAAQPPVL